MELKREWIEKLIYYSITAQRFTQDSPILPDVWIEYGKILPDEAIDLLMTPYGSVRTGVLANQLQERIGALHSADATIPNPEIAYNQTAISVRLTFAGMCKIALPLSGWWHHEITRRNQQVAKPFAPVEALQQLAGKIETLLEEAKDATAPKSLEQLLKKIGTGDAQLGLPLEVVLMAHAIGAFTMGLEATAEPGADEEAVWKRILDSVPDSLRRAAVIFGEIEAQYPASEKPMLYAINRNRTFNLTVWRSSQTVKADAAHRLFQSSCGDITWAVVDSGIDATHPAFRLRETTVDNTDGQAKGTSRVTAAYDFTLIRQLLQVNVVDNEQLPERLRDKIKDDQKLQAELQHLHTGLLFGREVDWSLLEGLLKVSEDVKPTINHGTHVAGILGADWSEEKRDGQPIKGMCPDIKLLDIRVVDASGQGDEFSLIAALQYLRWLNAHKDFQVVHGVNISLAIQHDVANYACGRTPVCEECERLVNSGLVVVAAAGNRGYLRYMTASMQPEDGYLSISITDPGNAEGVITVGSTHRILPHTYGVSYFSSRGPTGDGRSKPDLVAPGEKIESTAPNDDSCILDGTSMAAPHVSGAAALLMARHRELMGNPRRIKQILCDTATDLGRERYFQGCGLVDVLRAIQSV